MSDGEQEDKRRSVKTDCLLWCLSILCIGGGGALAFFGGWLIGIPGFILLIGISVSLSKQWTSNVAGAVGLWLFLMLSGLALSFALLASACNSFHLY